MLSAVWGLELIAQFLEEEPEALAEVGRILVEVDFVYAHGQNREPSACSVWSPSSKMNDFDSLPLLLTVDETAALLRTTPKAVYLMIHRGQLPGVTRVGKRVLVRRDDLVAWLDESRASSLKE